MYIAFRWLVGLTLTMWILMCVKDACFQRNEAINSTNIAISSYHWKNKNVTARTQTRSEYFAHNLNHTNKNPPKNFVLLHYIMFFAGGIAVAMFNIKNDIISYTRHKFSKIDLHPLISFIAYNQMIAQKTIKIAFIQANKNLKKIQVSLQKMFVYYQTLKSGLKINIIDKHNSINKILLTKLNKFAEERKKLGQLLVAAVHENKSIRTQYQLETLTKNRLVKSIANAHHQIKENRLQYVSFQHLYLITYQENILLKARIRKLKQEKENVEKNLTNIINKVCQTRNTELITYCSKFIVKPKAMFLQSDVAAEVKRFLEKSKEDDGVFAVATRQISTADNKCKITESSIQQEACALSVICDAPKLIGLPGERIWTVKDRNGLIEKLYEWDFKPDLESGDAVRRIREYSVYFDKDCLLDFSRSRVIVTEIDDIKPMQRNARFLTGSEAFKNFLQNCVVPHSRSKRSILCK